MDYKFHINEDWNFDGYKIYGTSLNPDYKSSYLTIKDGFLAFNPREEGEAIKEPLLTLNRIQSRRVLQALADALHKAGFVVEHDNKERITSQAIAEERKEQIDWLRNQIAKQL